MKRATAKGLSTKFDYNEAWQVEYHKNTIELHMSHMYLKPPKIHTWKMRKIFCVTRGIRIRPDHGAETDLRLV